MTMDKDGNVGIGLTGPSQKLDVTGSVNVRENVVITGTGTIIGVAMMRNIIICERISFFYFEPLHFRSRVVYLNSD